MSGCATYAVAVSASCGLEFHAVQMIERISGAVNIALLGLNMRDGLRLSRKRASRPAQTRKMEAAR